MQTTGAAAGPGSPWALCARRWLQRAAAAVVRLRVKLRLSLAIWVMRQTGLTPVTGTLCLWSGGVSSRDDDDD